MITTIIYHITKWFKKPKSFIPQWEMNNLRQFEIWSGGIWGKETKRHDQNNLQVYDSSCVSFVGILRIACRRLAFDEKINFYNKFIKDINSGWPKDKRTLPNGTHLLWTYLSGAVRTKRTFNMKKSGQLEVRATKPMIVCAGEWLYEEWHEQHGNTEKKGEEYFEIDLSETGLSRDLKKRGIFQTAHERIFGTIIRCTKIFGKFKGFHTTNISWDGKGNYIWTLNGVVTKRYFKALPLDELKPKLKFTLAVNMPETESTIWEIESVKFTTKINDLFVN